MRRIERLLHVISLFMVPYTFIENMWLAQPKEIQKEGGHENVQILLQCLMIGWLIVLVICHFYETIRLALIPNIISYLILVSYKICRYYYQIDIQHNTTFAAIYAFGVFVSIYLWNYCGEGDFIPAGTPSGSHGVGCKRFWTKEKQNHILVYYPISRKKWESEMQEPEKLLPVTLFGENQEIQEFKNVQWYMNSMKENPQQYVPKTVNKMMLPQFFKNLKIEAVNNAAFDFKDQNAKLVPIVFSHGLTSHGTQYTRHCMELASHGYIVFAIWHMGGCGCYTETKDGTSYPFDTSHRFYDLAIRKSQQQKREEEMKKLLDEILAENFLHETLSFPPTVQLDKEKLAMCGHSFGGIASVGSAMNDPRVKICIPMDPWFFPYSDQQDKICLKKTPILVITTETWYEWCDKRSMGKFDCKKATEQFFKNCEKQGNMNVSHTTILGTTHISQTDTIMNMPMELFLMEEVKLAPNINKIARQYLMNTWLQMDFMHKMGFINQYANMTRVRNCIKENKDLVKENIKVKQS